MTGRERYADRRLRWWKRREERAIAKIAHDLFDPRARSSGEAMSGINHLIHFQSTNPEWAYYQGIATKDRPLTGVPAVVTTTASLSDVVALPGAK